VAVSCSKAAVDNRPKAVLETWAQAALVSCPQAAVVSLSCRTAAVLLNSWLAVRPNQCPAVLIANTGTLFTKKILFVYLYKKYIDK
jgi:hypothetical protein